MKLFARTTQDGDAVAMTVSAVQMRLRANALAKAIAHEDAFDRIDILHELVNDLIESYADLRIAATGAGCSHGEALN